MKAKERPTMNTNNIEILTEIRLFLDTMMPEWKDFTLNGGQKTTKEESDKGHLTLTICYPYLPSIFNDKNYAQSMKKKFAEITKRNITYFAVDFQYSENRNLEDGKGNPVTEQGASITINFKFNK